MLTHWLVYTIDRAGMESILCECETPSALCEIILVLAKLGTSGPTGYRVIRVDKGVQ